MHDEVNGNEKGDGIVKRDIFKYALRGIRNNNDKGRINFYSVIFDKRNSYVILYLYLLPRSEDYAFNIAKAFRDAIKNEKWDAEKSKTKKLAEASKVGEYLREMERVGLLFSREDTTEGVKKVFYRINPGVLYQNIEIVVLHGNLNIELPKWDEYKHPEFIEKWLSLIRGDSIDEVRCIEEINTIGKYDYLTILVNFRTLIIGLAHRYKKVADKIFEEEGINVSWIRDCIRREEWNKIPKREMDTFYQIKERIDKELRIKPMDGPTLWFYLDYLNQRINQFIIAERMGFLLKE